MAVSTIGMSLNPYSSLFLNLGKDPITTYQKAIARAPYAEMPLSNNYWVGQQVNAGLILQGEMYNRLLRIEQKLDTLLQPSTVPQNLNLVA